MFDTPELPQTIHGKKNSSIVRNLAMLCSIYWSQNDPILYFHVFSTRTERLSRVGARCSKSFLLRFVILHVTESISFLFKIHFASPLNKNANNL